MLWLLPPVVALAGLVALAAYLRRREARGLDAAEAGLHRLRAGEQRLARRLTAPAPRPEGSSSAPARPPAGPPP